jgi:hypothetical protein
MQSDVLQILELHIQYAAQETTEHSSKFQSTSFKKTQK